MKYRAGLLLAIAAAGPIGPCRPALASESFKLGLIESNLGLESRLRLPQPAPAVTTLIAAPDALEVPHTPTPPNLRSAGRARQHLVGGLTTASWVLTGVFAVGGAAALAKGSADDAEKIGDVLQLVLPSSAYAMTWIGADGRGAVEYSLQLGTGMATTYGLKQVVFKRTPSAADDDSFPSAHTQAAFSGASFIHRRFGPKWGVPAYVLATYTGLSRVKAERHSLDDVIAGMSIALVSGWTFVHPIDERVTLNPILTDSGVGVGMTVRTGGERDHIDPSTKPLANRWRYTWEIGRITVNTNTAMAPGNHEDLVDFRFRQRNNPMVTSNLEIDHRINRHHELTGRLAPLEVREEDHFADPLTFGDITFDTVVLDTRYLGYDLRARWRYRIPGDGIIRIQAGAGIEVLAVRAEIAVQDPPLGDASRTGRGRDFLALPVAYLHLGLAPGRFSVFAEADGSDLGGDHYYDVVLGCGVDLSERWTLGLKYRWVGWTINSSRLSNNFESESPTISVSYGW